MRFYGQKPRSDDLDDRIFQLHEGPSPFDFAFKKPEGVLAHPVAQGQAGFSATEYLGTQHVGECVAIVLRDAQTGKTACAHVDQFSTPQSITQLFGSMPQGSEAMLLGAMTTNDPRRNEIARHNISKVLGVMENFDINVVAAAVQTPDQPSSIYIEPATGAVYEQADTHKDPDFLLTYAKMIISGGRDQIPLDTAFDLTRGPGRAPIPLRAQDVEALNNHVHNRSDQEIGAWFRGRPGYRDEGNWIETCVGMAKTFNQAYQAQLEGIASFLGQPTDSLRKKPLAIGQGALEWNAVELGRSDSSSAFKTGAPQPRKF